MSKSEIGRVYTNGKLSEITIDVESSKGDENNKLVYPAIYKHFKGKYYATMGVAECTEDMKLKDTIGDNIKVRHTETDDILIAKKHKDGYYIVLNKFKKYKNQSFVLYKSLYDDAGVYARPIDMFLSKVDHEKHPDIKQNYRFEIVRY